MRKIAGYLYRRSPRGCWYVRIRYRGKTIVKCTNTKSKREAEKKRAEFVAPYQARSEADVLRNVTHRLHDAEVHAEKLEENSRPLPQIEQVWSLFEANPTRPDSGPATLDQYSREWKRFVCWLRENHPNVKHLHEVSRETVEAYADDLSGYAASSYNQHIRLLRLVWRTMADNARLTNNPWDKIATKRLNKHANRRHAITPAQFATLLQICEADQDTHDFILLLGWSGLRMVDGALLQWNAIDFANSVITVTPRKTMRSDRQVIIPMFPDLTNMLNRRQSGTVLNPAGFVFSSIAADYKRDRSIVSKKIAAVFKKAGLTTNQKAANRQRSLSILGAHALRHHFASAAAAVGIPDAVVRSITGHESDSMLRHYQHVTLSYATELARRISAPASVKSLPESTQQPVEAPTPRIPAQILSSVREVLESMTPETLEQDRQHLLKLVEGIAAAP